MNFNYKILKQIPQYNDIKVEKIYSQNELIKYGLNIGNIKYLLAINVIKLETDEVIEITTPLETDEVIETNKKNKSIKHKNIIK